MSLTNNIPPPPPPPDIPILKPIGQGIEDLFNKIVGAFDRVMTRMVNEGGLVDMMESLAQKASNLGSAIADRAQEFSPFAHMPSASDTPLRQQEISAPDITPVIPPHVAVQVASAGIDVPGAQMVHVSEAAYVSPPHTPGQAVTHSQNLGLS